MDVGVQERHEALNVAARVTPIRLGVAAALLVVVFGGGRVHPTCREFT